MKPHPNHPKFNQKRFKDRDLTIDEHFIIDEYGQQVKEYFVPLHIKN